MSESEDARTHAHAQQTTEGYTLTVAEAAARLGKSQESVRRLIRTGRVPAITVRGERQIEYRLRPEDVHDALMRVDAQTHMSV